MPKRPTVRFDASSVQQMDWVRLAAFIDGEGTICMASAKGGYWRLQVQISNTNPVLMDWLKSTFLGNVSPIRPAKKNHKPAFIWAVASAHAEEVVRGCEPYLLLKKEQALLGLAYRKTFNLHNGFPLSEQEKAQREEIRLKVVSLNHRGVREVA